MSTSQGLKAAFVLSVAGVLLAACGGGGPSGSQPKSAPSARPANSLTVDQTGFAEESLGSSDTSPLWLLGATITNRSKTDLAGTVSLTWTAYGANGQVVGTPNPIYFPTTVPLIRAGQTLGVAGVVSRATAPVAHVTLAATPSSSLQDRYSSDVISGQNVSITPRTTGGSASNQYTISGTLVSGWNIPIQNPTLVALGFDSTGKIVGVAREKGKGEVPTIPPNGSVGWSSTMFYSGTPESHVQPAQVQLWGILNFGS